MPFYMVFGSVKRPISGGASYLDWSAAGVDNPLGVYEAANPDDACKAAASDTNNMGNFFAIEGIPWGVELLNTGSKKFGHSESAIDKLGRLLEQSLNIDEKIKKLEAARNEDDDNSDDPRWGEHTP